MVAEQDTAALANHRPRYDCLASGLMRTWHRLAPAGMVTVRRVSMPPRWLARHSSSRRWAWNTAPAGALELAVERVGRLGDGRQIGRGPAQDTEQRRGRRRAADGSE